MDEIEKLLNIQKEFFKEEDKLHPSYATGLGIHLYDHQLDDFSPSTMQTKKELVIKTRRKLEEVNFDLLDKEHQIQYHLFVKNLDAMDFLLYELKSHERDPGMYVDIANMSLFLLLMREFAPLEERLISIAERMKQIPRLYQSAIENLKNPPVVYCRIALDLLAGSVALMENTIPLALEKAPQMSETVLSARDTAISAMREFEKYINEELIPHSNGEFALGKERMDYLLTRLEMLDMDSDALWETGQRELEKCQQELKEFCKKMDPHKTWKEVFLETKKHHPPQDKILATYVEYLEKAKEFIKEHDLVSIPENQRLLPMDTPEFNRMMTPLAAYMPPAPYYEDKTAYLWVTPIDPLQSPEDQERRMRDHSYGKIQYVSLHEAFPGHHLQLVYAGNLEGDIYKRTFSNVFIEGWAFYTEQMMKERGYLDQQGELCQLEAAYWRALRILLDVGIHTKRFTYQEAYDFMQDKVDWAPFVAQGELNRYTRMPGQALSYYTGKLEILNILEHCKEIKGESFNLKEFHEALLQCGSLPPGAIRWKLGILPIPRPEANKVKAG